MLSHFSNQDAKSTYESRQPSLSVDPCWNWILRSTQEGTYNQCLDMVFRD